LSHPAEYWKPLRVGTVYSNAAGGVCVECLEQAKDLGWKTKAS